VRATTQQGRYQFLANLNNIHTTRTWDTRIPIGGTVATNARVVVNDIGTWRKDGWFHAEIPVDNANGPVYQDIRVYAAVYDPTLQTDVVTVASGKVSVAQLMETPGYDNKCALVSDSRRQFVYNAFGWLLEAQNAGVEPHLKANYSYYPDGRRARKIVCEWDGSTWVTQRVDQFYYEGWHLVAETRTSGSTQTVYRYTWGLDVAGIRSGEYGPEAGGIGGLLAITEVRGTETNVYFPVADHNGNIHSLIDATSGVTVANYEYDPYGVLVGETGDRPDRCSLRFQSKYFDRETGLYYYGYRYYDPLTTKWLTRDPLGERGGVNLTAFCEGDPVNGVDPLGLDVYVVYRQFNDIADGGELAAQFNGGNRGGIGHVYLAFDEVGVDPGKWSALVDKYHNDPDNPINPFRRPNTLAETFSFHPWSVRKLNGKSDLSSDIGAKAGLPRSWVTAGSYIGYNDDVDQKAFLATKTRRKLDGIEDFNFMSEQKDQTPLNAIIVKIPTTEEEQFSLYKKVQESRQINNINAESGDIGSYSVGWKNCGYWAVTMLEKQHIPSIVRGFNNGVGVDPNKIVNLHRVGQVLTEGVLRPASKGANAIGAQWAPYSDEREDNPVYGLALGWHWGR